MFANIQSFLEYIFGANITTICCVFMIIHIVIETIYMFKGRSKNDRDL